MYQCARIISFLYKEVELYCIHFFSDEISPDSPDTVNQLIFAYNLFLLLFAEATFPRILVYVNQFFLTTKLNFLYLVSIWTKIRICVQESCLMCHYHCRICVPVRGLQITSQCNKRHIKLYSVQLRIIDLLPYHIHTMK